MFFNVFHLIFNEIQNILGDRNVSCSEESKHIGKNFYNLGLESKLAVNKINLYSFLLDIKRDFEPIGELNNLRLELCYEIGLETLILIDDIKLYRIVSNLITNALKHSYKGTTILLKASLDTTNYLYISVKNEGRGIIKNDLDKVFIRFYQGCSGKDVGGFGIGLSHSKDIAENMGGDIIVDSYFGKTTEFVFRIRLKDEEIRKKCL